MCVHSTCLLGPAGASLSISTPLPETQAPGGLREPEMCGGPVAALGPWGFLVRELTQREGGERRGHAEWRQEHIGRGARAGFHAVQVVAKVGDGRCQLVHWDLEKGILLLHRPRCGLVVWGALDLSTRTSGDEQWATGLHSALGGTVVLAPA